MGLYAVVDEAELAFYSVKPWLFSVRLFCMFPSSCLQQKHCKVWAVRAGNTKNAINAFSHCLKENWLENLSRWMVSC